MRKILLVACTTVLFFCCKKEQPETAMSHALPQMASKDTLFHDVVLRADDKFRRYKRSANAFMNSAGDSTILYVNFNGAIVQNTLWNYAGNEIIVCTKPILTDAQQQTIMNEAIDRYARYKVKVTTDSMLYSGTPYGRKQMCVVTNYSTSIFYQKAGGVSYYYSMEFGDGTPCFVFADLLGNRPKYVGDAVVHEFAHATAGLMHDAWTDTSSGICVWKGEYRPAVGTGPLTSSSMMGYPYNGISNFISTAQYWCGQIDDENQQLAFCLGLKPDDVGDSIVNALELSNRGSQIFNGFLTNNMDVDMFKVHVSATSSMSLVSGGSTDFQIVVYAPNGSVLAVLKQDATLDVPQTVLSTLIKKQGTVYLAVQRQNDDAASFIPVSTGTGLYKLIVNN